MSLDRDRSSPTSEDLILVPITLDEPEPSRTSRRNKDIVGDKDEYRSVNFKASIKDDIFDSLRSDFNIPNDYVILRPDSKDRIYQEVRYGELNGLGISRTAFQCGLRVPIHAFVRKIVTQTGIALAQLSPNSFIHINSFINRCVEKNVLPSSRLFWHHFILTKTNRSLGFFAIGLRPGRQKWSYAPNNNKKTHKEWFYIFGPGLDGLNQWSSDHSCPNEWDPKLEGKYNRLLEGYADSQILGYEDITSEFILLCLRVSGLDVEKERKREEYRRKQASAQGKPPLVTVDKAAHSVIDDDDDDHVTLSELPIFHNKDCSEPGVETVAHKKIKIVMPKDVTSKASSSSVDFGRELSSLITFPNDLLKRDVGPPLVCSDQALARLSQGMALVVAEARQTAIMQSELRNQVEKHHGARIKAEKEVARLGCELYQTNQKNESLSRALADAKSFNDDLKIKVAKAQEAVEKAEEGWYSVGYQDGVASLVTVPATEPPKEKVDES